MLFEGLKKNPNEEVRVIIYSNSDYDTVNGFNMSPGINSVYFELAEKLLKTFNQFGFEDLIIKICSVPETKLCKIFLFSDQLMRIANYKEIEKFCWKMVNITLGSTYDMLHILLLSIAYLETVKMEE